ncbi:hypothetical protein VKT23_015417 [Stygiomarasmius scandens]|uniref:CFEM domain-containing protein n=1 Tax=Marasmiellus scandens TaxID=2682957 RepID=A0ABR1IZ22_9AGAR
MLNNKLSIILSLAILTVVNVNAQGTSSDDCLTTCITQSLPGSNCSGPTDISCLCTDTDFQGAVGQCIESTCPDQLATIAQTQQQQCTAASGSATTDAGSSSTETGTESTDAGASSTDVSGTDTTTLESGASSGTSVASSPVSGTTSAPRASGTTPSSVTRNISSGSGSNTASGSSSAASASGTGGNNAAVKLGSGSGMVMGLAVGLVGVIAGGFVL